MIELSFNVLLLFFFLDKGKRQNGVCSLIFAFFKKLYIYIPVLFLLFHFSSIEKILMKLLERERSLFGSKMGSGSSQNDGLLPLNTDSPLIPCLYDMT